MTSETCFHWEKCEYSDEILDNKILCKEMFYTTEKYLQNQFSS